MEKGNRRISKFVTANTLQYWKSKKGRKDIEIKMKNR